MLAVTLQLQPPPENRADGDLAGVQPGGLPLGRPVHRYAEVDPARWLACERVAVHHQECIRQPLRYTPTGIVISENEEASDGNR